MDNRTNMLTAIIVGKKLGHVQMHMLLHNKLKTRSESINDGIIDSLTYTAIIPTAPHVQPAVHMKHDISNTAHA